MSLQQKRERALTYLKCGAYTRRTVCSTLRMRPARTLPRLLPGLRQSITRYGGPSWRSVSLPAGEPMRHEGVDWKRRYLTVGQWAAVYPFPWKSRLLSALCSASKRTDTGVLATLSGTTRFTQKNCSPLKGNGSSKIPKDEGNNEIHKRKMGTI